MIFWKKTTSKKTRRYNNAIAMGKSATVKKGMNGLDGVAAGFNDNSLKNDHWKTNIYYMSYITIYSK